MPDYILSESDALAGRVSGKLVSLQPTACNKRKQGYTSWEWLLMKPSRTTPAGSDSYYLF